MCKPFPKSAQHVRPKGFSLVELMVAMALGLVLMAIAFTLFDQLYAVSDLAGSMADVNDNLRAAANLIARDLSICGSGIPLNGIALPGGGSGTTAATPVNMPGPGTGLNGGPPPRVFNSGAGGNMAVITPGEGAGPPTQAILTDVITTIAVNPLSTLNTIPLTGNITITATSATITLTSWPTGTSAVTPGQLIMLQSGSACLLAVSAVDPVAKTITFNKPDATNDPLGLNQFPNGANGPNAGTCATIGPSGAAPQASKTTASHINMVSYYLDNTSTPEKLMRLVGTGAPLTGTPATPSQPAQPVALGINSLQFTYDLLDGTTVNVATTTTPNNIRKVNLSVTATADHPNRKTKRYYSNTINTAVTVQNLAYTNKF